jgi:hypothetical protein
MIYGLFRASVLDEIGLYRAVLVPDRLVLSEVALRGEFVQADEVLWRRRFRGLAGLERQRRAFFLDGAPRYTRLPWWLVQATVFGYEYALRGKGKPGIGRWSGLRLTVDYLMLGLGLRLRRRRARLRKRVRRYHPRRLLRRAIEFAAVKLGRRPG